MRCNECEFTLNSCLGICDGKCLVKNEDVDFEQIKSLISSNYYKKNLPLLNIFFQRKAPAMIKNMYSEERLMLVIIAVYKSKLSDKQLAIARVKSTRVDDALNCENIKEYILKL